MLAVLCAATSLSGVLAGWAWLGPVVVCVGATLAAAAAARAAGAPMPIPTLAGALGLCLATPPLFFPGTGWWGVVPDGTTLRLAVDLVAEANHTAAADTAPVASERPVVFLTCLLLGLTALMVDLLAFGLLLPALAALPLAAVLAAASVVKTSGAGLVPLAATAAAFLLLLGAARPPEGTGLPSRPPPGGTATGGTGTGGTARATGIIAASVAAMLLLPALLPGFGTGLFPEGTRLNAIGRPTGVSTLLDLGNNLRSARGPAPVSYYTNSEAPVYLRTAVIGNLDAARWVPDDELADRSVVSVVSGRLPRAAGEPAVRGGTVTRVVTEEYRSPWLPLPAGARSVAGLEGRWGWSPATSTLRALAGTSSAGQAYTVISGSPAITAGRLERSSRSRSGGAAPQYSSVPDGLPGIVAETASRVVAEAGATTAYEQAVALQNHLRGPAYTYSEQTPLEQGYDGGGLDVVGAFLEQRSGYCVHYASAMALMARTLGIPSRIAIGYAPGRETSQTRQGPNGTVLTGYVLSARNAHAWPELHFPGIGWVPFEPTPAGTHRGRCGPRAGGLHRVPAHGRAERRGRGPLPRGACVPGHGRAGTALTRGPAVDRCRPGRGDPPLPAPAAAPGTAPSPAAPDPRFPGSRWSGPRWPDRRRPLAGGCGPPAGPHRVARIPGAPPLAIGRGGRVAGTGGARAGLRVPAPSRGESRRLRRTSGVRFPAGRRRAGRAAPGPRVRRL
jgi:transglutaminase-like putative cysteine protease